MTPIKVIIQRKMEPVKVVVFGFPKHFVTQIKWNVLFNMVVKAITKIKIRPVFKTVFKSNVLAKTNLKLKICHNQIFKSSATGSITAKAKIKNNVMFKTRVISKSNIKAKPEPIKMVFNSICRARSLIYKKWIEIDNDLTIKDLNDMTLKDFCVKEIL